jgi:hypothetical protein
MIGALLNTSDEAKAGSLGWQKPGRGFGFPLPRNVWDLYQGDDRQIYLPPEAL